MTQKATPDLIIHGGLALTMSPDLKVIPDVVIETASGEIASLSSRPGYVPPSSVPSVNASGCLVMPGMINGHTHSGMTLLRGVADDLPLHRWLNEAIFPLERHWIRPDFVEAGVKLAALEMIRSGTTTFNDMYNFASVTARVAQAAGLRAICGEAITEILDSSAASDALEKMDEFFDSVRSHSLVSPAIAPHSIYGVSEKTWVKIVEFAKKRGVRILTHLSETQEENEQSLKQFGVSPTEFFEKIGLWQSGLAVAAHATCLSERDISILGKYRVGVSHNPESNLKLGTQIAPIPELRKAGARVALGTDGTASNNNLDLLAEADFAAKVQIFRSGVGALTSEEIVMLLTCEGAAAIGMQDRIGSLEVGKHADVIAIDLEKAHAAPIYNPYSHLVYSATGADVKHTIVDGKVLMQDYVVRSLDEKTILEESRQWGTRIREFKK